MINAYIELLQEEGLVETREERSKRRQDHMNNVEDRETNVHSKLGNEEVTKFKLWKRRTMKKMRHKMKIDKIRSIR